MQLMELFFFKETKKINSTKNLMTNALVNLAITANNFQWIEIILSQ